MSEQQEAPTTTTTEELQFGNLGFYKDDIDYVLKRLGVDPDTHDINYELIAEKTLDEFMEQWVDVMTAITEAWYAEAIRPKGQAIAPSKSELTV